MTSDTEQLGKSIAKNLDRRKRRRQIAVLGGAGGLLVLALTYLQCGHGWGFGGKGKGKGPGSGPGTGPVAAAVDAGPSRCVLRLTGDGLTLDGAKVTPEVAVTRCKTAGGADVTVTGEVRQGDWEQLWTALDAAGVPTFVRGAPAPAP